MASTRRKVEESFTGMTLEQWQSNTDFVSWARTEPIFKQICYIVLNELPKVIETVQGCSEGRAFGRVEGFKIALAVLRSLTIKPEKATSPDGPGFDSAPENSITPPEVHD